MLRSFQRLTRTFRTINDRYRTPRIGMTPAVRTSLMVLRIYLLVLVALMLYKFALVASS
jgi:hypothetical protein